MLKTTALVIVLAFCGSNIAASTPFPPASLFSKRIRIRVLDGRNGKPIANDCVNVFVPGIIRALVIPTDRMGLAVLSVTGEHTTISSPAAGKACGGLASSDPTVGFDDVIQISSDRYIACQEYGKVVPGDPTTSIPENRAPTYSVKRILESGMAASNTCGKLRMMPKPGELILFVKPVHWWDGLRR